jgi:hypothetical protein
MHHRVNAWDEPELALVWENLEALCPSCHSGLTERGA